MNDSLMEALDNASDTIAYVNSVIDLYEHNNVDSVKAIDMIRTHIEYKTNHACD